jgi:glucose dehydrogenase
VGNPAPEFDGSVRPGDNLYTDCILALDLTTGAIKWYYQEVPHDVWGLEAASPPVLVKLRNGRLAVAEAGKTAWVYILDAATGALIRKSAPFDRQENMFAPPTSNGTRMLPGANGGSGWSPMSINPALGYAYVAGIEQPMRYAVHPATYAKAGQGLGSGSKGELDGPQSGTFTAIDINTGLIAWQNKMEQPMIGGSLATAGNLVFTGESNGHVDAFDAHDGRLLWQFSAGAGCNAAPMTYELDSAQYVAIACGGNVQLGSRPGDAVIVFALPRRAAGGVVGTSGTRANGAHERGARTPRVHRSGM